MKSNLLKLYDSNQNLIMPSEQESNKTLKVNMETTETACLSDEGDSKLCHKRWGI